MDKPDITTLTAAADALLETTENPRHRQILMNYRRHALLEVSGNWQPILEPAMTVAEPHYRMSFAGVSADLRGAQACAGFYTNLIAGGSQVFWGDDEQIFVSDLGFASEALSHQYLQGAVLREMGEDVDPACLYVKRVDVMMMWPYDERGRLIGEHVVEAGRPELIEVTDEQFITPAEAAEKLMPLIRPLPPYAPA